MDKAQRALIQGYLSKAGNKVRVARQLAGDDDALSYVNQDTARRAVSEAEAFVAEVSRYLAALTDK